MAWKLILVVVFGVKLNSVLGRGGCCHASGRAGSDLGRRGD